eukprot:13419789-Alexandrium_andersonii.AAC.1
MSASLVGSEMCIRDSRAALAALGSALWGAPNFCRLRAAERAVWPFGRAAVSYTHLTLPTDM